MPIKAPFLPLEKLRSISVAFLAEHHPEATIPVPIERIVERDFAMDIVPVPGLHDLIDIDSYPTSDLTEIHVDDFVYKKRPKRYRFSLAHEISHLVLHKDIFEQLSFTTIAEWRNVITAGIPPDEYGWIEWQAYALAGLILVPEADLKTHFDEMVQQAGNAGMSFDVIAGDEAARAFFHERIGETFVVSGEVISKRMKADKLWPA